jgi:hypothetical protein
MAGLWKEHRLFADTGFIMRLIATIQLTGVVGGGGGDERK